MDCFTSHWDALFELSLSLNSKKEKSSQFLFQSVMQDGINWKKKKKGLYAQMRRAALAVTLSLF